MDTISIPTVLGPACGARRCCTATVNPSSSRVDRDTLRSIPHAADVSHASVRNPVVRPRYARTTDPAGPR